MSRLSFRPRPLDIHKKLPIVKSVKDFEDYEDVPTSSTRSNSQFLRSSFSLVAVEASENDNGHQHQISIVASTPTTPSSTSLKKDKVISEIPTPQYVVVESYEQDYARTFSQPNSYLRARGGLNCLIVCFFFLLIGSLPLCLIHIWVCSPGWVWGVCGVWSWQWGWGLAPRIQQRPKNSCPRKVWFGFSIEWKFVIPAICTSYVLVLCQKRQEENL